MDGVFVIYTQLFFETLGFASIFTVPGQWFNRNLLV